MKLVTKSVFTFIIAAIVIALTGVTVWYKRDRTEMLSALCNAGLPNFSRPSSIDADAVGCAILGKRRRVSGIVLTYFEVSNLIESDLPAPPTDGGFTGSTWMTCNQVKGCDKREDQQLQQKIPGLCNIGLASVVAYGWVTESPGHYGHLGIYSREFFEDEVVTVSPPPASIVEAMRRRWSEAGISKCS